MLRRCCARPHSWPIPRVLAVSLMLSSHQVQGSDDQIIMIITLIIAAQRRGIGAVKTCPRVNCSLDVYALFILGKTESIISERSKAHWLTSRAIPPASAHRSGLPAYAFFNDRAAIICKIVVWPRFGEYMTENRVRGLTLWHRVTWLKTILICIKQNWIAFFNSA